MIAFQPIQLRSYGLNTANVLYYRPDNPEHAAACLDQARRSGLRVCPMGGGMSFSDVGLLDDQVSLDLKGLDRILEFDETSGCLRCEGGTLTASILQLAMPKGWYLCGLSGSLMNTVAGDISNNINGKDSWRCGNFGSNVISMKILLADGSVSETSATEKPDLFHAVIGGMGLLGIILEVTLQLTRIPSFVLRIQSEKAGNINDLIGQMEQLDQSPHRFFYAWIDAFARGSSFGRSILETASFVANHLGFTDAQLQAGFEGRTRIAGMTPENFWRAFRLFDAQLGFRVANVFKYHLSKQSKGQPRLSTFPDYQYPLVKYFPNWNLRYSPLGFREFQPIFSRGHFSNALQESLEICRKYGEVPSICATRKHHAEPHYLSFSGEGYSFTVPHDLNRFTPARLESFTRELMEVVLRYGGKIYLGKFPYITPEDCRRMYPKYGDFTEALNRYNPDRLFYSNAAARLFA